MGNWEQEPSYEQKAEFYRDRKRVRKENRKDPESGQKRAGTGESGGKDRTKIEDRDHDPEPKEDLTETGSDRKVEKKDTLHSVYDKIKGLPGRKIVKQNEKLLGDRDVQGVGFLRRYVARTIYVTSTLAIVF